MLVCRVVGFFFGNLAAGVSISESVLEFALSKSCFIVIGIKFFRKVVAICIGIIFFRWGVSFEGGFWMSGDRFGRVFGCVGRNVRWGSAFNACAIQCSRRHGSNGSDAGCDVLLRESAAWSY